MGIYLLHTHQFVCTKYLQLILYQSYLNKMVLSVPKTVKIAMPSLQFYLIFVDICECFNIQIIIILY